MPDTFEPDSATLARLDALQEENRCPKCGERPRLQTQLPTDWIETAEVSVTVVPTCDCAK